MPRYKVTVQVSYHITADDAESAKKLIDDGAEFPVVPYDDETYCDEVTITEVTPL